MSTFLAELKRRSIFKVGIAYAIVAWLLIEVASTVLPTFNTPDWVLQTITFVIILGFPLALIFAWAFELTPEGIKPAAAVDPTGKDSILSGRRLDFLIIGLLVLALVYMIIDGNLPRKVEKEEAVAANIHQAQESVEAVEHGDVLPNSIAVLPFENLSPDPDNAYFAAGIHESTLNQLSKVRDINVIARTSVMQYKDNPPPIPEIARALKVEMVMEGSVRYANNRVLITAQLIDGKTGTHLWSDEYNRDLTDIFAVQAEIAMNIANALKAKFSTAERRLIEKPLTKSPEAFALYLKTIDIWRSDSRGENLERGFAYLNRAIEIDPNFAWAYVQRARFMVNLFVNDDDIMAAASRAERSRLEQRALQDLERALEIDQDLGYAHAVHGIIYAYHWRLAEAKMAFQHALNISPNDSEVLPLYTLYGAMTGIPLDEVIQVGRRAIELDPNNPLTYYYLGAMLYFENKPDEAVLALREAITLRPNNFSITANYGMAQTMLGRLDESKQTLQHAEELITNTDDISGYRKLFLASCYKRIGLLEHAIELISEFQQWAVDHPAGEGDWAGAYLAIGDYEKALDRLNKVVAKISAGELDEGFWYLLAIRQNISSDPVLDQGEFLALRRKLGFRK